jgi:hypothetical protein
MGTGDIKEAKQIGLKRAVDLECRDGGTSWEISKATVCGATGAL